MRSRLATVVLVSALATAPLCAGASPIEPAPAAAMVPDGTGAASGNPIVPAAAAYVPADFMVGLSARDMENLYYWDTSSTSLAKAKRAVDDVAKAGGRWWRPHIIWRFVEPNLLYPGLSMAQVTSALVDQYTARTNWSFYDSLVSYAAGKGVQLIFVLGAGYIAPFNQMPIYAGRPVTPRSDVSIGTDAYVANCYLHARACVRRYKTWIHWWQCENEINMAGYQTQFPIGAGYTWRDGAAWWDGGFCQRVLTAIRDGVKAEDPGAVTTLNFHQLNKAAISAWAPLLDVVGYDYYPMDIASDDLLAELQDVQSRAGSGKPILLCETGYDPGTGAMTPDKQRSFEDWMLRSYNAAVSGRLHGGVNLRGYLYFTGCTAEIDQDGERMGLVESSNAYKWGFDVLSDLFGAASPHVTGTFNDFEASTGFAPCASSAVQAVTSNVIDGNVSVKLVTSTSGYPGTGRQCVMVTRPDGSTMSLSGADRIGLFVYDTGGSNSVQLTFVDGAGRTFTTWSDQGNSRNAKTQKGRWTLLTYPTASVTGIDTTRIRQIRVGMFWAGTYYVDRIMRIR